MADPRVARLAEVAIGYSTAVQPGDLVLIDSTPLAAPLVRETVRAVLAAGGNPHARFQLDGALEALIDEGSDEQLGWLSPARAHEIEHADVRIVFESEVNTRSLTGADPARQALAHKARKPLSDRLFERVSAGELRWLVTLYPTSAAAQDAGMSLPDYEDFVYGPASSTRTTRPASGARSASGSPALADWLTTKRELRIVAEDTDLTLGVEGRTWIPSSGHENFPDGEIFTGPVETSVEGTIRFSYPAQFQGRVVEGVQLRFAGGEVVAAEARQGQAFLEEMLALDDGARRVGEFAFGMNEAITEFTLNTLFDEKIGGTMHMALGRSYPVTGGTNVSALHWDMVSDLRRGGEVYADGELVYRDGRFLDA